jgi:hypothetical protein
VQTSTILKDSALSVKKIKARSSTSSWESYIYE